MVDLLPITTTAKRRARRIPLRAVSLLALLALVASTADAALISINTSPLSVTGAEIRPYEKVLYGWNVNGNAATAPVINGVTFQNARPTLAGGQPIGVALSSSWNAHPTDLASLEGIYSGAMEEVMEDISGTGAGLDGMLTLSGLAPGGFYQVQMLHHQPTGTNGIRRFEVHFGSTAAAPGGGQVEVGAQGYITTVEFIADSPTQQFFFNTPGVQNRAILNGFQISTVPEPATLGLMIVGLLGVCGFARHRALQRNNK